MGAKLTFHRPHGQLPSPERQTEQLSWLVGKLERSNAPIKLVFGHHGIFSIGKHGGEKRMSELDDLLRGHAVTAYINGHDHCMYHITHKGIHYICSGAGSQMLPHYSGGSVRGCVIQPFCIDTDALRLTFPVWHSFLAKQPGGPYDLEGGFAAFEVTDAGVSFTFYMTGCSRDATQPVLRNKGAGLPTFRSSNRRNSVAPYPASQYSLVSCRV